MITGTIPVAKTDRIQAKDHPLRRFPLLGTDMLGRKISWFTKRCSPRRIRFVGQRFSFYRSQQAVLKVVVTKHFMVIRGWITFGQ